MIPDLPTDIDQIKGFLAEDEAQDAGLVGTTRGASGEDQPEVWLVVHPISRGAARHLIWAWVSTGRAQPYPDPDGSDSGSGGERRMGPRPSASG